MKIKIEVRKQPHFATQALASAIMRLTLWVSARGNCSARNVPLSCVVIMGLVLLAAIASHLWYSLL